MSTGQAGWAVLPHRQLLPFPIKIFQLFSPGMAGIINALQLSDKDSENVESEGQVVHINSRWISAYVKTTWPIGISF
jgi:hypothetical protein